MKNVYAEVLTIGDEILYGQTLDTNTRWIGEKLHEAGVRINRKLSIPDDKKSITETLDEASCRADIVLITGGLGPTKDDITKHTLAAYFNTSLVRNHEALEHIKSLFASRGRTITPTNERQADLPEACTFIKNRMGTAPAMWFERAGVVFVSMPGVPYEMECIMEEEVIPRLKSFFELPAIQHQMIQTVGIGESWLSDKIADWENQLPAHIRLAYLPSFGKVKLRLTALGDYPDALQIPLQEQTKKVLPLIKKYVFAVGSITLEEAIGRMLIAQQKKVALAESCSGGYVAHSFTSIPGSSAYFQGAVVPYHNEFKEEVLGVQRDTLVNYGAVSEQTVIEMAEQVRAKMKADYGLASSGVAGPGGGSEEKPVGTVWIAVAREGHTETQKLMLTRDRLLNIKLTSVALLNLLRKQFPEEHQWVRA